MNINYSVAEKRRELEKREADLVSDFIDLGHVEECLDERFQRLLKYALDEGFFAEISGRIGYKAHQIAIEEKSGWLLFPDRCDRKEPETHGQEEPHPITSNV